MIVLRRVDCGVREVEPGKWHVTSSRVELRERCGRNPTSIMIVQGFQRHMQRFWAKVRSHSRTEEFHAYTLWTHLLFKWQKETAKKPFSVHTATGPPEGRANNQSRLASVTVGCSTRGLSPSEAGKCRCSCRVDWSWADFLSDCGSHTIPPMPATPCVFRQGKESCTMKRNIWMIQVDAYTKRDSWTRRTRKIESELMKLLCPKFCILPWVL